jgi:hypothetical protein
MAKLIKRAVKSSLHSHFSCIWRIKEQMQICLADDNDSSREKKKKTSVAENIHVYLRSCGQRSAANFRTFTAPRALKTTAKHSRGGAEFAVPR